MFATAILLGGALLGLAAAAALPEQIALNYGASPSEMVVSWAAATSEAAGEVRYGLSSDSLAMKATTTGATYTLNRYTSPMLFKATMTGLVEGNKEYFYRVGSDATGFSEVFSFKSNPGVGKGPITFHVMGDLGQTSNSQETLQEILDNEAALAPGMLSGGIVSMGDLSYANGNQPEWDTFGRLRQMAATKIPMLTTLGNLLCILCLIQEIKLNMHDYII